MKHLIIVLCLVFLVAACCREEGNPEPMPEGNPGSKTAAAVVTADTAKPLETIVERVVYNPVPSFSYPSFLYLSCANPVSINLPAGYHNASIDGVNAMVLRGTDSLKYTVTPTAKNCNLMLRAIRRDDSAFKEEMQFRVIEPPKPQIQLFVNGTLHDGITPVNARSNLQVKIIPDIDFRNHYPKDARYMISSIDLLVQRSLGAPNKVASFNGAGKDATQGINIPLGNSLKSDRPGTKAYLKVNAVKRINFQNKPFTEPFQEAELVLGFIIK